MLEREIDWRFGPPETIHWGGIWERKLLHAITRDHSVTDKTLLSSVAEEERILNERPLESLSDCAKV
ncbi:unnamed protein product [Echinostoma caproni]|uniref:Uncharacterized protein n=1 Tax=Echinostoma caproni TaxID=27848 RepID=A0A183BBH2_9TREM|nr:unnamed protein product [Echinostoma caproni]